MKHLLTLLLFISTQATAETFAGDGAVTIYSNTNCGDWLDARKKDSSNARILENRVVGFLDGLSYGLGFDVWEKPTPIVPSQLFYMVDNECRNDPSKKTQQVLADIYDKRR